MQLPHFSMNNFLGLLVLLSTSMDITKKIAPSLWNHAPAFYFPSAGAVSETLRLTVVPVDGENLGSPFHVNADPSTKLIVMHNLIRNRLLKIHIGEYHRSGLEILPLQATPTLD
jgi:hypothetical protein